MIALTLALGLWSRFVYWDKAEGFDADSPTAQEMMSRSSDWVGMGQYVFPAAIPIDTAKRIINSIENWKFTSELFLFLAGLLTVWLLIDVIAPVLDRMKSQRAAG